MIAFGNEELANSFPIGKMVRCPKCGNQHAEYGEEILADGTRRPSTLLGFVSCSGSSYLVSVAGKDITRGSAQ